MKEVSNNVIKHPIATLLIISGLVTGVTTIIGAVRDYRVKVAKAEK